MRQLMIPFILAVTVGGCGYFNSLYNANRHYSVAERAARSGDRTTAIRSYREAIERAAVSYRKYPESRWADDALLLIGRARFELGEDAAAAGAMDALLARSQNASMRGLAHAYAGAARLRLDQDAAAAIHLDSAAAILRPTSDDGAFARLWRARTAFDRGNDELGWSDLDLAAQHGRSAYDAALEGTRRAGLAGDSARFALFVERLASTRLPGRSAEAVESLLMEIMIAWSPAAVFHGSAPLEAAVWPAVTRDGVTLTRAAIAAEAGEIEAALALASGVANAVSGGIGGRARLLEGRLRLAAAESVDGLEDIRQLLRPAYDQPQALGLMRSIRAVQILAQDGSSPAAALSLFAAAEMAHEDLGAPLLARRLFLDFFAIQRDQPWAGKAVLAAHMIAPDSTTAAALATLTDDPYVRAARGVMDGRLAAAEERIAYGTMGLRASAIAEAIAQDAVVGRAVAVLDSARAVARLDSVRISCGAMLDTLALRGIRADSTRSACLRGDTARVAFVIRADTTLLRDTVRTVTPSSTGVPVDSDTIQH